MTQDLTQNQDHFKVCFFDILGFKSIYETNGLNYILEIYKKITKRMLSIFEVNNFLYSDDDNVFHTADREIAIYNHIKASYASDTLLIWSKHYFKEAQNKTLKELKKLSKNQESGWQYLPIPNDTVFLSACEIICSSIEVGIPIRGILCAGEAALNSENSIFIGKPLIIGATLEKTQNFIGASIHSSILEACSPSWLVLDKNNELYKKHKADESIKNLLNWPVYWLLTRRSNPINIIDKMKNSSQDQFKHYYENTINFISQAIEREVVIISPRIEYPQFRHEKLKAAVKLFRKSQIDEIINIKNSILPINWLDKK
jgi:hypothetical protein